MKQAPSHLRNINNVRSQETTSLLGTLDSGLKWSPGRPLVLQSKLATSFIVFVLFWKLPFLALSPSLKKAIVFPNRFKPSPGSLAPLVNNFQGPYLKNNSYSFRIHSIPGNCQPPNTQSTSSLLEMGLYFYSLSSSSLADEPVFLLLSLIPSSSHFFPATDLLLPFSIT